MKNKFSSRKIIIPSFAFILLIAVGLSTYFFQELHRIFRERQQVESFHHIIALSEVLAEDLQIRYNSKWNTMESAIVFCETYDSKDFFDLKIFLRAKKYEWDVEDIALYTESGKVYDELGTEIEKPESIKYLGILPTVKKVYAYEEEFLNYLRYVNSSIKINGERLVAISTSIRIVSMLEDIGKRYFDGKAYFALIDNEGNKITEVYNSSLMFPNNINTYIQDCDIDYFGGNEDSILDCLQNNEKFVATLKNRTTNLSYHVVTCPIFSKEKYEPTRGHLLVMVPSEFVGKNYSDFSTSVTKISGILILIISIFMLLVFLLAYKNKSRLIHNSMEAQELSQNEKLKMALSMAEQSNSAKTSFLSNMSHDIRTPLNAIISMTDFALQEKENPKKVNYYLEIIKKSSNHLMQLINNVLDMTRIESGKMIIKQEPFDMSVILDDVTNIVRSDCNKKKITLYTEISCIEHTLLIGDRLNVQRILINLLSNAVKFTPELGSIWFTIEENKSLRSRTCSLRFEIEDTGYGIKKELLPTIFKPFVRESTSKTSNIEGTGLGLAITKNLIEAMGGSITVESEENKGTKFIVDLFFPISSEENVYKAEKKENFAKSNYDFGGIKALVVEDNSINRQIIGVLLQNLNIKFEFVENGKLALEKFNSAPENAYDLIYMDIQMPELNGYETTEALRSGEKKDGHVIPIIAMTANVFDEDVEKCRKAGMNAHIGKPIDPSQLAYVTNMVLSKKNTSLFSGGIEENNSFLNNN